MATRLLFIGLALLVFGVLSGTGFGRSNKLKTENSSSPHIMVELTGETVTVSSISDSSIGYGQFRVQNQGAAAITATVNGSWLELDGQRQLPFFEHVSVFDIDHDLTLNPHGFEVGGETILTFLIGFPSISQPVAVGQSVAIGLALDINGTQLLQAQSPIKIEKRIPLDR